MADTQVTRNLSAIDAELKKINQTLRSAASDSRALDKALRLNPSSLQLARTRTAAMRNELELTRQKLDALRKKQKEYDDAVAKGLPVDQQKYRKLKNEIALTEAQVESLNRETKKVSGASLDSLKAGFSALGKAATACIAAVAALSVAFAKEGDEIDKTSKKLGISAETYQRWAYIFEMETDSANNYVSAMKSVQSLLGQVAKESPKAERALAVLGLTMDDLRGKGAEEAFNVIVRALSAISDEEARLTAANVLLGESGASVAWIAGLSNDQLEELNKNFEAQGYLSDEQVAKAAEVADAFTEVKQTYKAVVAEIGVALAPALKSIAQIAKSLAPIVTALANAFAGLGQTGQLAALGALAALATLPSLIVGIATLKKSLDVLCTNPVMAAVAGVVALTAIGIGAAMLSGLASSASANTYAAPTSTTSYVDSGETNITINATTNASAEDIADEVAEALVNKKKERGYV